jgi:DNA-binding beta-propeller fold protein YncE
VAGVARQAGFSGAFRAKGRLFRRLAWVQLVLASLLLAGCPLPALKEGTATSSGTTTTAPAPVMTLLAGGEGGNGSADGTGPQARFLFPQSVATDSHGLVFIADSGNHTIRVMDANQNVTTLVGKAGESGSVDTMMQDGGIHDATRIYGIKTGKLISDVRFSSPEGIAVLAVDASHDDLYIADSGNSSIRLIRVSIGSSGSVATATADDVTTIAGMPGVPGNTDALSQSARLRNPVGLVLDGSGSTLYFTDSGNNSIRTIDLRLPGAGGSSPLTLPLCQASSSSPPVPCPAAPGYLVSTIAGAADHTVVVGKDGVASQARFLSPTGIAMAPPVDSSHLGNLFVADTGANLVRELVYNPTINQWLVITVAGSISSGGGPSNTVVNTAGYSNGGAAPTATSGAGAPLTVHSTPFVYQTSGSGTSQSALSRASADGGVLFNAPTAVVIDPADSNAVFVADTGNNVVRHIALSGIAVDPAASSTSGGVTTTTYVQSLTVTTVAGMTPIPEASLAGSTNAVLIQSTSLVYYPGAGDFPGVTSGGMTTLSATNERTATTAIPPRAAAQFSSPAGLAADPVSGSIYIADLGNSTIRRLANAGSAGAPVWQTSTLAGAVVGAQDGQGTAAGFNGPQALGADADGNVYVADTGNQSIRKIASDGTVTTLAGLAGVSGLQDAAGSAARFSAPAGLAVDAVAKKIYVADSGNNLIRVVDYLGNVTTLTTSGSAFSNPVALSLDGLGHLYVADQGSKSALVVDLGTGLVTSLVMTGSNFARPSGIAASPDGHYVYMADVARNNILVYSTATSSWNPPQPNPNPSQPNSIWPMVYGSPVAQSGAVDAAYGNARFNGPTTLALDAGGNLLVADTGNQTLRRVTLSDGMVSTVLGTAGSTGAQLGVPGLLSYPRGITVRGTTSYLSSANLVLKVTDL